MTILVVPAHGLRGGATKKDDDQFKKQMINSSVKGSSATGISQGEPMLTHLSVYDDAPTALDSEVIASNLQEK